MALWNFWKKPEPIPMTPEEREVIRDAREVVQEAREFVQWAMKLPRPVLEAWRDRLIEEGKRKNP